VKVQDDVAEEVATALSAMMGVNSRRGHTSAARLKRAVGHENERRTQVPAVPADNLFRCRASLGSILVMFMLSVLLIAGCG